jgi:hypothetical protein
MGLYVVELSNDFADGLRNGIPLKRLGTTVLKTTKESSLEFIGKTSVIQSKKRSKNKLE